MIGCQARVRRWPGDQRPAGSGRSAAGRHYQVPKVICRVMDPARAEWYAEQGLHTICPTSYAIEMFERALEEV